jgi:nucleoside 2-deoxyribosyltransferase
MTYKPGRHIYLAAGFFNDSQKDLCSYIESKEGENVPIYSPRIDGGVLKPDAEPNQIKEVFDSNKISIETARMVLAVIDDYDPGVIWEMGFAHAKRIRILGYSDIEGRGLNVMLAGSCNLGFINGRDRLGRFFYEINNRPEIDPFPKNTWSGLIQ